MPKGLRCFGTTVNRPRMKHRVSQSRVNFACSLRLLCAGVVAVVLTVALSGCGEKSNVPVPSVVQPQWNVSVLEDTVGSVASLEGLNPIPVRGYGLVMGLADTGSREAPDYVVQIIRDGLRGREREDGQPIFGGADVRDLVMYPSTAVVVVEGSVPPAAAGGDKIDLTVQTLPGTQTTSLAGGELFVSELSIERPGASGAPVRTRPWVVAGYPEPVPVFMDPFSGQEAGDQPRRLRSGRVIGGGQVVRVRPLRLVLRDGQGSYRLIRRISDRLNFRFPSLPGEAPTAEGESSTTVKLVIPREYHNQKYRFLMLVLQTYLYDDPGMIAQRAKALIAELANPQSDAEKITAALESIGNSIDTTAGDLRAAYKSRGPRLAFYGARTAARLGDNQAISMLGQIAMDDSGPHQLQATAALGELPNRYDASYALRPLLDSKQTMVRIQAYEALARKRDPAVIRQGFARPCEFGLDVVVSNGAPLVYIKTMKEQRIAIFGRRVKCADDIFYLSPDKCVTITSKKSAEAEETASAAPPAESDRQLTLLRCTPSGKVVLRLSSSSDLVELIKKLGADLKPDYQGVHHGLGLDYSQTVAALYGLYQSNGLEADFALQPTAMSINLIERSAPAIQRPETKSQ